MAILTDQQLDDASELNPGNYSLLILYDARTVPAESLDAIVRFVHEGGDIMALGGPAFSNPQWRREGKWISKADYLQTLAGSQEGRAIFGLDDSRGWSHANSEGTSESKMSIDGDGSLRMDFVGYDNWENFTSPAVHTEITAANRRNELTCLRAKGSAGTSQLAVEWKETDGSRWIATIALTPEWQNYFLPPAAFSFWAGGSGRGGNGDSLHIKNASVMSFGLSHSHTVCVRDGDHTAWVSGVKFMAPPDELGATIPLLLAPETAPSLELISPYYRIYSVTNLDHLVVNPNQVIAGAIEGKLSKPANVYACAARPQGTGIEKHRSYRFVPLLECVDKTGKYCGAAGAMAIQEGKQHGSITIAVPIDDAAFFEHEAVQNWLAALAERTLDGTFLTEGGTPYYVGFAGESMPMGASVSDRGNGSSHMDISLQLNGELIQQQQLDLRSGGEMRVNKNVTLPTRSDHPMRVSVVLKQSGKVIDRLDHELRIWQENPHPSFVTVHDGHFYLDGKQWRAHGINYMPTSGIGAQSYEYFQFWLDAKPYDPDVIQRDLDDIQSLGGNAISVFVSGRSVESRNFLDLLARCGEHGIKVNLAIPGSPMNFPWDEDRRIIEKMHLASNDTIFAYDIAWEPRWQGYASRCQYDTGWRNWVEKHYGDVGKAAGAWGIAAPMRDGHLTGPSDEQVSADGPWRKMVLDYRQFQNDLLAERYGHARDLIRSIDPNHLISFRMSMAGDPTYPPSDMCYDFGGLKDAVDFLGPEGYGRIGDWNRVRIGDFTVAYGRAAAPKLPVVWAEFGVSDWNIGLHGEDPVQMKFAGQFYDDFYRMIQESGADGSFPWWLAGGYRVNERSDYGVLNPDRSWRPEAVAMHRWASILAQPREQKPAVEIPIRVGQYVDGIHGIYEQVRAQFFQAMDAGKQPVLTVEPVR